MTVAPSRSAPRTSGGAHLTAPPLITGDTGAGSDDPKIYGPSAQPSRSPAASRWAGSSTTVSLPPRPPTARYEPPPRRRPTSVSDCPECQHAIDAIRHGRLSTALGWT